MKPSRRSYSQSFHFEGRIHVCRCRSPVQWIISLKQENNMEIATSQNGNTRESYRSPTGNRPLLLEATVLDTVVDRGQDLAQCQDCESYQQNASNYTGCNRNGIGWRWALFVPFNTNRSLEFVIHEEKLASRFIVETTKTFIIWCH